MASNYVTRARFASGTGSIDMVSSRDHSRGRDSGSVGQGHGMETGNENRAQVATMRDFINNVEGNTCGNHSKTTPIATVPAFNVVASAVPAVPAATGDAARS